MIINAINKFCAKHGRITYLFIGVVIIIPFVFLYGDFGGTLQGGSSRNAVIGKMYSKAISRKDFLDYLRAIRINFYLDYQRYVPANNDQVIKALSKEVLNRMRALYKAEELGINHVTPKEIQEKILKYTAFQEDEKFDKKKFDKFRDDFLKAEGLSAQEFDQIVRENIIVDRIEKQVTESVITPEAEARAYYVENFTKCKAQISNFYYYRYQNEITVSEQETEEYFNKNLETKYRVPEQKQAQFVIFNSNDYLESTEIDDDELMAYYEEQKSTEYSKKQIRLKHILARTNTEDSEDLKKEKKTKLTEVLKELTDKDDFSNLAKIHSEDKVTADKGGNLGFLEPGDIRNRYGAEFAERIAKVKLGEVSGVVESKMGYHLVHKIAERDTIPFVEVRDQIRSTLEFQKDEEEANKYYKENKEADYSEEQVQARHILIKVNPDDTDEVKSEKRQKLEDILKKARENKNFYELAKLHSEDASNASKGGDLGYFGKGQMVKPFEETAFSMEKGEISEIVETQFGYHIIEKIDERSLQPFSEVKEEIISTRQQEKKEKAKAIAVEKATKFAVEAHSALTSVANDQKAQSFIKFCNQYNRDADKVTPIESGFFTIDDYNIPNIDGSTSKVVKDASNLSMTNPLSEVMESGDQYYVCCWQASKDSYLPKFKEPRPGSDADKADSGKNMVLTKQGTKAERDLKAEMATAKAMEECRKAYEEISAKLKDGILFDEAIGEVDFTETGEFTLSQGPRIANAELVKKEAERTAANSLAPPKEISNGALLIYIESHTLPSDDDYEQIKSFWLPQFQNQQQQVALQGYYKELEEDSATVIVEEWQFLFETETDGDAESNDNT